MKVEFYHLFIQPVSRIWVTYGMSSRIGKSKNKALRHTRQVRIKFYEYPSDRWIIMNNWWNFSWIVQIFK